MANEWNFCSCKSFGSKVDNGPTPVWDALFQTLSAADPYGRQMSIHNGALLYNHSQPWISHVSLQGHESDTPDLRTLYGKPVIWDEERCVHRRVRACESQMARGSHLAPMSLAVCYIRVRRRGQHLILLGGALGRRDDRPLLLGRLARRACRP